MEDVLQKMDPKKRERLINSALKEFGTNSYDKASTNTIVKEAGISKGLLYHYFNSKESLYNYLIKFLYQKTADDLIANINMEEQDILERITMTVKYKIVLLNRYPSIMEFTKKFYEGKTIDEMKTLVTKYTPNFYYDFYHKNINYKLFKDGVDINRVLNMTQWTIERISETSAKRLVEEEFDIQEVFDEVEKYMAIIRQAFYK